MPDDDRIVVQLAAAFRRVIEDDGRERADAGHARSSADPAREHEEDAVVAAAGAALGDERALPPDGRSGEA